MLCQPSPFATSIPIELQKLPQLRPSQNLQPLSDDAKKKLAWKYEGYQEFSRWMASDDDFFIIRRFQNLNANVILYMQDRVTQIEERLREIHENNVNAPDGENRKNCSFRWDMRHEQERNRLMCELTGLLHHYNQYVETFSKIRSRPKADKRQVKNLKEFFKRGAINEKESAVASNERDLMSINSQATSPLGRMLEACRLIRLSRLVEAKRDPTATNSPYTHYASDTALANLTTGSIILLGFCMLLGPMWWLEYVSNSRKRLVIITVFIAIFMGLMSTATVNKPFEVVASSAAYAAVLMVFMQIDNSKG
ncbi:uncharacterized protein BDR25DRAFT_295794 [Lindgomyces ingoldianus]|uniref:Uncharacterized protein n=1 Tax=Lindgomyces ingoldianus TaxID=673940 RepID=A0ACB6QF76_9PLEO|nr:uncharacterized protein BDR25DRAFT_295794 [Lindgomyces ingoldianus]KAF2465012.1 hypothetical protein BDR25DRAFT_295794 [Lindgomyces ingoldianus]